MNEPLDPPNDSAPVECDEDAKIEYDEEYRFVDTYWAGKENFGIDCMYKHNGI